jgi:hypothetical protein
MWSSIRTSLARIHNHVGGWTTKRRIVVIESDDWGAIRMPSSEVYEQLQRKGFDVDRCPYARNDSLESGEDLARLFTVLDRHHDASGRPVIVTANTVVANPDFDRIKDGDFGGYFFEPFTRTYDRYPGREHSWATFREGIKRGLFLPQFHGREHVNLPIWFQQLRRPGSPLRVAFDYGTWSAGSRAALFGKVNIQASFDATEVDDLLKHRDILTSGMALFEEQFGFRSTSFIANNFIYHPDLNPTLQQGGICFIQGMKYQKCPILNERRRKLLRHAQGSRNALGQIHLVRNALFEPAQKPEGFDAVGACLRDVASAFFWRKPAIISMHRLNVIGSLRPENRDRHLQLLDELLTRIRKNWPDVRFMSSPELGEQVAATTVAAT